MTETILEGKTALVTGASRGLGQALAVELAAKGAHVICLARTVGGLEETDDLIKQAGGQATLMPFNLKKVEEIIKLGPTIAERFGGLDVLIGNAGILGEMTPIAHYPLRLWNDVMTINVTANQALITACDPMLRASAQGRALFLSSGVAQGAHAYWGAYAVSKAALESLVLTYAAELENTDLKVNLIDPGVVRTKMRAQAIPGENPQTLPTAEEVAQEIIGYTLPSSQAHGQVVKIRLDRHAA